MERGNILYGVYVGMIFHSSLLTTSTYLLSNMSKASIFEPPAAGAALAEGLMTSSIQVGVLESRNIEAENRVADTELKLN